MSAFAHSPVFAAAISVDLNLTFVAQFLLFSTFLLLLKPMLFNPLLRVFEERERRTEGAKAEAREMDAKAGDLLNEYETELAKVRSEANLERERLRAETAKLEAKIMSDGREETAKIIAEGKARIDAEVAQLRQELERTRPELAAQIASRLLGREVAQ